NGAPPAFGQVVSGLVGDTLNVNDQAETTAKNYTLRPVLAGPGGPQVADPNTGPNHGEPSSTGQPESTFTRSDGGVSPSTVFVTYTTVERLNLNTGQAANTINVRPSTTTFLTINGFQNNNTLFFDFNGMPDARLIPNPNVPGAGVVIFLAHSHVDICFQNITSLPGTAVFVASSVLAP